jgi:hypothetical protein
MPWLSIGQWHWEQIGSSSLTHGVGFGWMEVMRSDPATVSGWLDGGQRLPRLLARTELFGATGNLQHQPVQQPVYGLRPCVAELVMQIGQRPSSTRSEWTSARTWLGVRNATMVTELRTPALVAVDGQRARP